VRKEIPRIEIEDDDPRIEDCAGCREDFYNSKNPYGIKQCWSFKRAKVVWRKFVHVEDVPPWRHEPERTLNCYQRPRHISIDPRRIR